MLKIDLLRHGQSTLSHTLRGSTDDDLTELGWSQMQHSIDQSLHAQDNEAVPWDVIFSSPLKRCRLFADRIAQQIEKPVFYHANLQEMHFGDWEALSTQYIYENEPELLANFWQQPTLFSPPNAETMQNFHLRVINGLTDIQQQMQANHWQHALLVTHGGVIKLLKCIALKHTLDDLLKMSAELGQLDAFILHEDGALAFVEHSA
ncbi:histidine phosphatase family protein [Acinetobacter harbinensis]|uniref:histidine phosphatase family protein n=1 Tax=Acinetobacter harbinensis TaxID=1353941 RepID=UPI001C4F8709|nr:histidine phosphatase family protein [Acinetobacter harbinensis]